MINLEGGIFGYLVFYEGLVFGSFSMIDNNIILMDVFFGIYDIKMVDVNGCYDVLMVEVFSFGGEGFFIWLEGMDVFCG